MNIDTPMRVTDLSRRELLEESSLNFTRYLSCLVLSGGYKGAACDAYIQRFPDTHGARSVKQMVETGTVPLELKAAVLPGSTSDATWAKPLVPMTQWANGFLAIAHSQSLLGRLKLEVVPFNCKIPYATADANYTWVAEAGLTPVSKLAFSDGVTVTPTKALGIVVLSEELARFAGTMNALRNALVGGLNSFLDKQFLDPTVAAVAGKNPASILNGLTPLTGTADVAASVKALIASFFTASPGATAPVLIAGGAHAAAIRGQVPGFGLEVLASEAAGTNIIIVDPARVFIGDAGLEVNYSREAALEMADPATSPPTAAVVLTSLFQQNLAGFRVLRFVSWAAAPNAVKYSTMP